MEHPTESFPRLLHLLGEDVVLGSIFGRRAEGRLVHMHRRDPWLMIVASGAESSWGNFGGWARRLETCGSS